MRHSTIDDLSKILENKIWNFVVGKTSESSAIEFSNIPWGGVFQHEVFNFVKFLGDFAQV